MSDEKSNVEEAVVEVIAEIEDNAPEIEEKVKKSLMRKIKDKITPKKKDSLYLNSKTKGVLDAFQEKLISRKLLVFLTATGLLVGAGLDPDTWGMIAMFYIGGQSAIDAVQVWRHGK